MCVTIVWRRWVCASSAEFSGVYSARMIVLDNVYKAFGTKQVLSGFSLEVREGDIAVLLGYSGTGKSVAIKHIVGLLTPDMGTVFVDGREVPRLSRRDLYEVRSHIGYVFQFAALFDSLTVGENVAMGLRKQGKITGAQLQDRVHEALELVDLPNAANTMPSDLSGGMRKRVGIARAIALRPKYLLYDEPTTGLDPVTAAVIDELMQRMQRQLGVTSIVITHDLRTAWTIGTRISMLYDGKVRQTGTPDEIRNTKDPVVRQFIEGRATPVGDGVGVPGGSASA
jgi:phospholipid/cholesterol/gamma-HCH transport system ATP-binding protein